MSVLLSHFNETSSCLPTGVLFLFLLLTVDMDFIMFTNHLSY
jgi:hypothetical protein